MKKYLVLLPIIVFLTSCGGGSNESSANNVSPSSGNAATVGVGGHLLVTPENRVLEVQGIGTVEIGEIDAGNSISVSLDKIQDVESNSLFSEKRDLFGIQKDTKHSLLITSSADLEEPIKVELHPDLHLTETLSSNNALLLYLKIPEGELEGETPMFVPVETVFDEDKGTVSGTIPTKYLVEKDDGSYSIEVRAALSDGFDLSEQSGLIAAKNYNLPAEGDNQTNSLNRRFLTCPLSNGDGKGKNNCIETSRFGDRIRKKKNGFYEFKMHQGIDLSSSGTPVVAAASGVVARTWDLWGEVIIISPTKNISSANGETMSIPRTPIRYLHLSKIDVKEGDAVKKGDKIGISGGTGPRKIDGIRDVNRYADHLHFEVFTPSVLFCRKKTTVPKTCSIRSLARVDPFPHLIASSKIVNKSQQREVIAPGNFDLALKSFDVDGNSVNSKPDNRTNPHGKIRTVSWDTNASSGINLSRLENLDSKMSFTIEKGSKTFNHELIVGTNKELRSSANISLTEAATDETFDISAKWQGTEDESLYSINDGEYYYLVSYSFSSEVGDLSDVGSQSSSTTITSTGGEHCQGYSDSNTDTYPGELVGNGSVDNLCYIDGSFVAKELRSEDSNDSGEGAFISIPYITAVSGAYMKCDQGSGSWTSSNIHSYATDSAGNLSTSDIDRYTLDCKFDLTGGNGTQSQSHNTKFTRKTDFGLLEKVKNAINGKAFGSTEFEGVLHASGQLAYQRNTENTHVNFSNCSNSYSANGQAGFSVSRELNSNVTLNITQKSYEFYEDLPQECR